MFIAADKYKIASKHSIILVYGISRRTTKKPYQCIIQSFQGYQQFDHDNSDIIWVSRRLNSLAIRLFVQKFLGPFY